MKLKPFDFAKVKIETNDMISKLSINDEDFSGAMAVKIEHKAGEIPTVTVTLPVDSVEFDGNIWVEQKLCIMGGRGKIGRFDILLIDLLRSLNEKLDQVICLFERMQNARELYQVSSSGATEDRSKLADVLKKGYL